MEVPGSMSEAAMWDDVEHGSYSADLGVWAELAAGRGPVLDLGCGAGRVSLHLAREGHEVWAMDQEEDLIDALDERAGEAGLAVRTVVGDVRDFELDASFGLIAAPMQLVQLLRGEQERGAMLSAVRRHLEPDGLFAAAVMDPPLIWGDAEEGSLPDVREHEGWVCSSLPLGVRPDGPELVIERLRQTVSPSGELTERRDETRLDVLEPERLEAEAAAVGLVSVDRISVPATDAHVGSLVVVLEASDE
jgi:SAM-dependent methyltransferase